MTDPNKLIRELRRAAYGQPTASPTKTLLNEAAQYIDELLTKYAHAQHKITKLEVQYNTALARVHSHYRGMDLATPTGSHRKSLMPQNDQAHRPAKAGERGDS
jgi:hypothetical protein